MQSGKLLVAVDFSEPSIQALVTAINLCRQLQGVLHIVYFVDTQGSNISANETEDDSSVEARLLKKFRKQLESLVEKMGNGEIDFAIEVEYGDPVDGIIDAVSKVNAEMIVMGTHGRTGIEHLVVGSVAESVLRKATVPLVCVRGRITA